MKKAKFLLHQIACDNLSLNEYDDADDIILWNIRHKIIIAE